MPKEPDMIDHEIRLTLMEKAVTELKTDLDKINANLSKLVWIAATALILAVANWIIKGGLAP